MTIELTEGQRQAKITLLNAVATPNSVAVLTGYAGTGKTTLIVDIIRTLQDQGIVVSFAAPTHKAVSVAGAMLAGQGIECETATIHKMFGLRVQTALDGTQKISPPNKRVFGVLIVDEASMIDDKLYQIIVNYSDRVIFVGDPAQLPPVEGDGSSPALNAPSERAHLSQVMRQAKDNPIILLATWLRSKIEHCQTVCVRDIMQYLQEIDPTESTIGLDCVSNIPLIAKSAHENGMDCRVLAFSNINSSRWGREVKRAVTGEALPLSVGDPVIFNNPQIVYDSDGKSRIVAENNQDAMVQSASEIMIEPNTGLKVQRVVLAGHIQAYFVPVDINEFRECKRRLQGDLSVHNARLKMPGSPSDSTELKDKIRFLTNNYADLRLNWSMTVHKSQGSTFDCVIVDLPNVLKMPKSEVMRGLYVAITRPSKYLVLCAD